jgi:hypothetical protein
MRVYDIIALNEELDVKPGVLGSDGKPVSWQVVDKQTGRVAQTFSGPDADGKAEEFRDTENAKRRGGKPQDPKTDPKADPKKPVKDTEPSPKNKTLAQKIAGSAVNSGFRNVLRIGRAIGFSQLPGFVEDDQLIQADLYARYVQAIENGNDPKAAKQEFEALSKAAFGQWVLSSGVITLGAEIIVRAAKAGTEASVKLVKAIRAWNAGTTAAAAATGVGLLPGVIKFVLVEGAIWAVSYALASEAVAKSVFKYFVGSSYDESIKLLYQSANLGQAVGSGIANIVGDDETKAAWRDVKNAMGMDPMRKGAEQAIGKQVNVKAPPRADAPTSGLRGNVPD